MAGAFQHCVTCEDVRGESMLCRLGWKMVMRLADSFKFLKVGLCLSSTNLFCHQELWILPIQEGFFKFCCKYLGISDPNVCVYL